jgi:guanylate kinase
MSRLTVLAGPTAVGKGTVVRRLVERYGDVWVSISATTRSLRPGEIDGVDYYFVSERQFDGMIAAGEFLEWATVHGTYRYGTPRQPVEAQLAQGMACILEIDLAVARQVREAMPEAQLVFLAPPSWEELIRRLEGRGTESREERKRRLDTARIEMAAENEFDEVVINDELDETVDQVHHLVVAG